MEEKKLNKKIQSAIAYIIISLIVFVLLSTISTIFYKHYLYNNYINKIIETFKEPDYIELFEKTNKKLDIIKASTITKFEAQDKKVIEKYLSTIKNNISDLIEINKNNKKLDINTSMNMINSIVCPMYETGSYCYYEFLNHFLIEYDKLEVLYEFQYSNLYQLSNNDYLTISPNYFEFSQYEFSYFNLYVLPYEHYSSYYYDYSHLFQKDVDDNIIDSGTPYFNFYESLVNYVMEVGGISEK